MKCPVCDGVLMERPRPDTQHYAEWWCSVCNRHCGWVPAPTVAIEDLELPPGLSERDRLPELVGTPKQVSFAELVRSHMLSRCSAFLPAQVVAAMRTIADASWWIANKDRDEIRWPRTWPRKTS